MNQFTDNLVKEKIFNCKICYELCTSDIFLVKGKGNVCGKCFEEKCEEDMRFRAELNTALMLIIAKLMLPCKFQSKGCDKRVWSKLYSKHIVSCDFKTKPCPMKNLESCGWSGSDFELTDHLLKNHHKHVVKGDNNLFKVETSFSKLFDIKILSSDWQNYLLRTLIADNKLYYGVNPLDKNDECMEYSVVHKSVTASNNTIKTIGTLTKLNGFYNEQNLNENPNATAVNIDTLKHLINDKNMIINHFNLNPKELDENMVKLLECPVCMHIMRPPIYQCNRGHNICILCQKRVRECPTCRGQWIDVRNLFVENLTTDVKYPCKFKRFGCKENGIEGYIKKHEEVCLYLSKILGCQICRKTMRPPIFNCHFGHSVCFECKENNKYKCPICEFAWINTKNDALESLTFNVKYPCKNYKLGCKEFNMEIEIRNHEKICPLNVKYKCPMLCEEAGSFEFILKHLNDAHKGMEYTGNQMVVNSWDETLKWIVFDSRLFRISYYLYDYGSANLAVELVCSNENPDLYTYKVNFSPYYGVQRKNTRKTCLEERKQPLHKILNGVQFAQDYSLSICIKKT